MLTISLLPYKALVLILFMASPLLAQQNSEPQDPQEEKKIGDSVKFKVYAWFDHKKPVEEGAKQEELYFRKGERYFSMALHPAEVSPEYKSSIKGSKLVFYRKVTLEDKVTYEPVTLVDVKDSVENLFLYIYQQKETVSVIAVDTSLKQFPKGNFCFINPTNQDLVLSINEQKVNIIPKSQTLIKYKLNKKQLLRIVVQTKDTPNKNLAVMSVSGREEQRLIGFFYPINNGRSHRILIERGVDSQAKRLIK